MRSVDCRTHELVEFKCKSPPYITVSRTWEDVEVTFQEMSIAGGQAAERKCDLLKSARYALLLCDKDILGLGLALVVLIRQAVLG